MVFRSHEFTAEIAERAEKKMNNLYVLCSEILLGTASDLVQFQANFRTSAPKR